MGLVEESERLIKKRPSGGEKECSKKGLLGESGSVIKKDYR